MRPCPIFSILASFLVFIQPAAAAAAVRVLLWAPPGQGGGLTESAGLLGESLHRLGIEHAPVKDILSEDLSGFEAVFAVLGTFPRTHALTPAEVGTLAGYLHQRRGALYLEGGDAWYDLSAGPAAELASAMGIGLSGDGAGDLASLEGLDASPGPDLSGLTMDYEGENRSLDRLRAEGEGALALWRNRDTGRIHAVFRAAPEGYRTIGASFEFGGLQGDRDAVLLSYLAALGLAADCAPAVRSLGSSAGGRRVVLTWENGGPYLGLQVTRDGGAPVDLPALQERFEEEPGPGEHHYQVVGMLADCRTRPAFSTAVVLEGAHLIWRPVETLAGPGDSAREVRAALLSNGRGVVTLSGLSGLDLRVVAGLWAILGTRPYQHRLSSDEGTELAGYLRGATGPPAPRLYLEGGDVWWNGPDTALRRLGGVKPVADGGARPLRHLRGLDTRQGFNVAALVRLPVDYTSELDSLDVLEPDPEVPGSGAAWIDDDSGEVLGVFRRDPAGRYAVLSASFEFGGVTGSRAERALLMGLYLTALEVPPVAPQARFRRGDVDGDGTVGIGDPIQILEHLFLAGRYDQDCEDAADADDDGAVGLSDPVGILNYLFLAGPAPAPPGPEGCGPDPTALDGLPGCRPLASTCG